MRKKRKLFTKEEDNELMRLDSLGVGLSKIAEILSRDKSTIRARLKREKNRAKFEATKKFQKCAENRLKHKAVREMTCGLWLDGCTVEWICDNCEFSQAQVKKLLKECEADGTLLSIRNSRLKHTTDMKYSELIKIIGGFKND